MQVLILGGARSGKSRYAELLAHRSQQEVIYFATATAGDKAMQERISHHQLNRPVHWQTIEEPLHLASRLQQHAAAKRLIIVDCLTLWLTNLFCMEEGRWLDYELTTLLSTVSSLPGDLILVSNEVGLGIVPMGELTRRYIDEAGRLHQRLASQLDTVLMMFAGLPHVLKGTIPWNG